MSIAGHVQVMGCALLKPLEEPGLDGHVVGELGAFCTRASCRGSGIGDSLLEWLGAWHNLACLSSPSVLAG